MERVICIKSYIPSILIGCLSISFLYFEFGIFYLSFLRLGLDYCAAIEVTSLFLKFCRLDFRLLDGCLWEHRLEMKLKLKWKKLILVMMLFLLKRLLEDLISSLEFVAHILDPCSMISSMTQA